MKEITVLRSTVESDGSLNWKIFIHFPIDPVIEDFQGNTVNPQNSSNLPSGVQDYFSSSEWDTLTDAIDNGTRGFTIINIVQTSGESNADFLNRLELYWNEIMNYRVQRWRDFYSNTGRQVSI